MTGDVRRGTGPLTGELPLPGDPGPRRLGEPGQARARVTRPHRAPGAECDGREVGRGPGRGQLRDVAPPIPGVRV